MIMNLNTHYGYPEGQRQPDGAYVGRIYGLDGRILAINEHLEDKDAYKAWVSEVEDGFRLPVPAADSELEA